MREKLNALFVERVTEPGYYCDGGGLYLVVRGMGGRSWVLRSKKNGVSREFGLGSYSTVTLAQARQRAREYQIAIHDGKDPRLAKCADITDKQIEKYLSVEELLALPRDHVGVYFLFSRRKLQYIGQSANVAKRVEEHKRKKLIPFDDWVQICVSIGDLDAVEAMYIRRHKPPFNKGRRTPSIKPPHKINGTPGTMVHDRAPLSAPYKKLTTISSG